MHRKHFCLKSSFCLKVIFECSKEVGKRTKSLRKKITRPLKDGRVSMAEVHRGCGRPTSAWVWSWAGRSVEEIAKISRPFLCWEDAPRIGSDLVTLVPQGEMKKEGEFGGEVTPGRRHLEQVAFGSFHLKNRPRAKTDTGAAVGGSAKHSSPPGSCSWPHSGRVWKALMKSGTVTVVRSTGNQGSV